MGHRGYPCGHALSPVHGMPRPLSSVSRPGYLTPAYPTPDTWDLTPVDPVVRTTHCLSRFLIPPFAEHLKMA